MMLVDRCEAKRLTLGVFSMKLTYRNRLLATTLLVGSAIVATPSFAQTVAGGASASQACDDNPNSAECTQGAGDIVVTGSRIIRSDLDAPSPVAVVSAETIQLTGTQTVESLLNEMPQIIPGNTRVSNNSGGENFATLDLRGLGPQRTLILLNGERLPPSSSDGVVDVSQIPVGLIQRVEVLTGGASTTYGSDAMAGVINFILKDRFQGVDLNAQTSVAEEGVGFGYNIAGTVGGNFADDRGNLTFYGSYFKRSAVGQGVFPYSRTSEALVYTGTTLKTYDTVQSYLTDFPTTASLAAAGGFVYSGGGSATNPYGTITNSAANPISPALLATLPGFAASQTPVGCGRSTASLSFNSALQLSPTFASGACVVPDRAYGSTRYNFAPVNYLITPYTRFNFSTLGSYDFDDKTSLKLYSAFTRAEQQVNLAPTPATGIVVPYNAFGTPADLAAALASRPNPTASYTVSRRFTETGPRDGRFKTDSFSIRTILEHDFGGGWKGSLVGSYGRVDNASRGIGNINAEAVAQGIRGCVNSAGVVNGPGILPGCVPFSLFRPLSAAATTFVQTDIQGSETFEQSRVAANIAGNLFELPAGPVGIAVGAEYRKDRGETIVDDAQRRGNIYGFNAVQSLAGSIDVREVYGEIRVPLLGGGSGFPNLLAVEAGARYSDYSSIGSLFNWKAGAEFAPFKALRFRGTYAKAARAPSVFELFQNGDQGFPAIGDPCNATTLRLAATRANCLGGGGNAAATVPAALIDSYAYGNSQVQAFSFGDPTLKEERAETFTLGGVFSPGRILGGALNVTVDYYNIKITNRIASLSAQFYANQCYLAGSAAACARITRDSNGQLTGINTGRTNDPTPLTTAGIDTGVDWTFKVGDGSSIYLSDLLTYVDKYKIGGTNYVDTAEGGIGGVTYRWGNTATVGYRNDFFTGQVRYVWRRGGRQDYPGGTFEGYFPSQNASRIPDLHLVNASVKFNVNEHFEMTLIANNLLDKFPPQTASGFFEQANTNINFYDGYALGRNYTVQARLRF